MFSPTPQSRPRRCLVRHGLPRLLPLAPVLALTLFLAAYRIAVMVCPPPRASLSAPPPFPIPRSDYPPHALPIRTSLDRVLAFASGVIDVVGSALAASWALHDSRNQVLRHARDIALVSFCCVELLARLAIVQVRKPWHVHFSQDEWKPTPAGLPVHAAAPLRSKNRPHNSLSTRISI